MPCLSSVTNIFSCPLDGVLSMLFLLSTTSTTSCTLAFFWGATQSTIWCLATRIITDLLGLQSLAGALGLLTAVRGVACSLGPPAGAWLSHSTGTLGQWLVDMNIIMNISGTINNVFLLSGCLAMMGSIFILISWTIRKYKFHREEKQDNGHRNYGSID